MDIGDIRPEDVAVRTPANSRPCRCIVIGAPTSRAIRQSRRIGARGHGQGQQLVARTKNTVDATGGCRRETDSAGPAFRRHTRKRRGRRIHARPSIAASVCCGLLPICDQSSSVVTPALMAPKRADEIADTDVLRTIDRSRRCR